VRERAPVILGTIALAAIAIGLVVVVSGRDPEPTARAPESADAGIARASEPRVPEGIARDLAARLVQSLDGGRPLVEVAIDPETGEPHVRPADPATPPPTRPVPATPPQPRAQLGRPMSLEAQVEFAGTFHDWVILRRDEQRRRLAELEASGQGESGAATAIRRELARLDETEPRARARFEELAERARLGREATGAAETEDEEGEATPDEGEDQAP
jgi:hypothetical protein